MPRFIADTILYPVVKPAWEVIGTEKKWVNKGDCYRRVMVQVDMPIHAIKMQRIGVFAATIEDAKVQGCFAPILDLNHPCDHDYQPLSIYTEAAVDVLARIARK